MAIKITVSDTVAVRLQGTINDADGPQPFDFTLLCRRLDTEQLRDRLQDEGGRMDDFIVSVTTGWRNVRDDDGELPFTEGALRRLLRLPNLAQLAFDGYLRDVGAKAKN